MALKKGYQALSDYVWVKCDDPKKVTAGGIILPDTAAEDKPQQGEVLSIGPGRVLESGEKVPMHVAPGDRVIFGAYAGIEAKLGGELFLVIRQDDILLKEVEFDDADASGG